MFTLPTTTAIMPGRGAMEKETTSTCLYVLFLLFFITKLITIDFTYGYLHHHRSAQTCDCRHTGQQMQRWLKMRLRLQVEPPNLLFSSKLSFSPPPPALSPSDYCHLSYLLLSSGLPVLDILPPTCYYMPVVMYFFNTYYYYYYYHDVNIWLC